MSNFAIPFSCVALLGAVVFYGTTLDHKPQVKKVSAPSVAATYAKARDARIWVVTNLNTKDFCLLYKTRNVEPQKFQLDIDPACDMVFNGSGLARYWVDHGDDQISFEDQENQAIARFKFDEKEGLVSVDQRSGRLLLAPSS